MHVFRVQMPNCGVSWCKTPGPPFLYRCSCNCTHVEARAPVERVSTRIVDVDTKTVTTAKTGRESASLVCPCSLVTSVYTLNVKLEGRSAAVLYLVELHAISDTLGKHL